MKYIDPKKITYPINSTCWSVFLIYMIITLSTKLQWVLHPMSSDALKGTGSYKVLNKKGYKIRVSEDSQPLRLLDLPQVCFFSTLIQVLFHPSS